MKVLTKIEVEGLHWCVFSRDEDQSQRVAAIMVGKCMMMPVNINNLHALRHSMLQHVTCSHVYSIVLALWAVK